MTQHVAKTHSSLTGRCTRCGYEEAQGHATNCDHYDYWRMHQTPAQPEEQARTLRCNSSFYDNRSHHCTREAGHVGPHEDVNTYWRDYQPPFELPGFIVTPKAFSACRECEEPELCASHGRCARAVLREAEQATTTAKGDDQARTLRERLEALRLQILEWAQGVEDCAEGAHAGINAFIHDMRLVADSLTAPAASACTCSEFGSGTQPCSVHGGSVETLATAPAEPLPHEDALGNQQAAEARGILASQHATFDSENAAAEARIRSSAPAEGSANRKPEVSHSAPAPSQEPNTP